MKQTIVLSAAALLFVGCDVERGAPPPMVSPDVGYDPPGRGTTAFEVREAPRTNGPGAMTIIRSGPGGAIPGGTRTTSPSIPGTREVAP